MPHELGLELVVVALELGDTLRLQLEPLLGQDALRRQLFVASAARLSITIATMPVIDPMPASATIIVPKSIPVRSYASW